MSSRLFFIVLRTS
jgi:hypothetical protein